MDTPPSPPPTFFYSALFNALRRQPFLDSCSVFFFVAGCFPKRGCSVMRTDPADAEGPRRFVAICSGIALCMCSHFLVATAHGWWSRLFHLVATTLKAHSGAGLSSAQKVFRTLQRDLLVWKPAIKYSYSSRIYQVMTPLYPARSHSSPFSMPIRVTFVYYA